MIKTKHMRPAEEELSSPPAAGLAFISNRQDLLRRFTSTPHNATLSIMGNTVRLESNNRAIVDKAVKFFERYQGQPAGRADFLWRIVGEATSQEHTDGVELTAFSDHGLRFANIGQRSFLAVDLHAREAVAVVSEEYIESEPLVHCRPLFDTLFCMCAGSFGKVAMEAACVGSGQKGVLIFGPPSSGKTTTSYLAARLGLEFHADQAVFLEMQSGKLQAWGDLMPAIFRADVLHYLPELRTLTRRFSYPKFNVHYLSKRPFQGSTAHPILPVGCVFLNRGVGFQKTLLPVAAQERMHRLLEGILYREDGDFGDQTLKMIDSLCEVPGYELAFSDPAAAAVRIRKLLLRSEPALE